MKYWIDTEFIDLRPSVHLISIGIVAEDGRELYMELSDAPLHLSGSWVKENVISKLIGQTTSPEDARRELETFIGPEAPEFWLWYGAYDWVAFTQLWGRMVDAPKWALNDYYNDLRQYAGALGPEFDCPPKPEGVHNALFDARWTRDAFYAAERFLEKQFDALVDVRIGCGGE